MITHEAVEPKIDQYCQVTNDNKERIEHTLRECGGRLIITNPTEWLHQNLKIGRRQCRVYLVERPTFSLDHDYMYFESFWFNIHRPDDSKERLYKLTYSSPNPDEREELAQTYRRMGADRRIIFTILPLVDKRIALPGFHGRVYYLGTKADVEGAFMHVFSNIADDWNAMLDAHPPLKSSYRSMVIEHVAVIVSDIMADLKTGHAKDKNTAHVA